MATISVPGKLHLIGEHAVVYGEPAILASVDMRLTVKSKKHAAIRINAKGLHQRAAYSRQELQQAADHALEAWQRGSQNKDFSSLFSYIKADKSNYSKCIIGNALEQLKIEGGIALEIASEIPLGAGLGSSAALAIALPKAIAEAYGITVSKEQLNRLAYSMERLVHGNPSGGDNTACCYGGLVWFKKKGTCQEITPLEMCMGSAVLVNVGKSNLSTGELVAKVAGLSKGYRKKRIRALGFAALQMRRALEKDDKQTILKLIQVAQNNLCELGVSTPEIDEVVKIAEEEGGAAKLCGAGGGGMVLCYHPEPKKMLQTLSDKGFTPIQTLLGAEGVRTE